MQKNRLEAFSDGVIAIIITIMVLELKVPHGHALADLKAILPVFISYILSFIFLGIYWNSHHHLLLTVKKVNGNILWANLHLLFWLSLIPFVTGWMGENLFMPQPVALYGVVMLMSGMAFYILSRQILLSHGKDSLLAKAVGKDYKSKASLLLYFIAILSTVFNGYIACGIYVFVAMMWLIPDKRIERVFEDEA